MSYVTTINLTRRYRLYCFAGLNKTNRQDLEKDNWKNECITEFQIRYPEAKAVVFSMRLVNNLVVSRRSAFGYD